MDGATLFKIGVAQRTLRQTWPVGERAENFGCSSPDPKIRRGRLPERNFHFGVAARYGRVHGGNDLFHLSAQSRPLLVSENHKSDFSARQVLLVPDVLVGCQQKVKARSLSGRYQFAVHKPIPSPFDCFHDYMTFEGMAKRGRGPVIKEYERRPFGRTIALQAAHPGSGQRIPGPLIPVPA